jgi:hypothetical protein
LWFVLTQKNSEGDEFPVDFMSSGLQGVELNYPEVDKHAYVVFKVVKHFRPFLLKYKTKVIVPYPIVRNLLVQRDLAEKRENWITALQEYDLEIKPAKMLKGKGYENWSQNPPALSLRKMLCINIMSYLKKKSVTSHWFRPLVLRNEILLDSWIDSTLSGPQKEKGPKAQICPISTYPGNYMQKKL